MKVQGKHYRTVWLEGSTVKMINQNKLPFEFEIMDWPTAEGTCVSIKDMYIRGAGAIGATAGYAMAQVFMESNSEEEILKGKATVEATRPTAQNLFYATERVYKAASGKENAVELAVKEAEAIAQEDANACAAIGKYGAELIKNGMNIETHCNAGWLAFVDNGSAISPIYEARNQGKKLHVWVDETRPRSQGARLTAWELYNEEISHQIIPDNAGAHIMSHGKVDMMIVGADRVAANGDAANKIGTLEKAIAAKYYGIPFYVAAPLSTIDLDCETGKSIPIENRSEDELLYQTGPNRDGDINTVLVASPGSTGINPGFDVTPAELITGIITPKGIIEPSTRAIKELFE